MAGFEQALKRLLEDPRYREAVVKNPTRLTEEHNRLDAQEILLLMQVWHASGNPRAEASILTICHCCCSSHEG
jgi:hypothetical protein